MQYLQLIGFLMMFLAFSLYHYNQIKALEKKLTTKATKAPIKRKAPSKKNIQSYQLMLPLPNMIDEISDQAILDTFDGKRQRNVLVIGSKK